jgi:NAD(P)-dependent dehydrogenase (short-subunit alcohol dehydrogenase family)
MSPSRWTPADIPDLAGRIAVVTGANSGLGLHTSTELARHGAHVVMTARDPHRGDEALRHVREQVAASGRRADVELLVLDLADLSSVRAFAASVVAAHHSLDLLVNNAGVMALPRRETTVDGFERQLATNHLGHFALTGLLLPALLTGPSRVVTVSSMAHRMGRIALDDLQSERAYQPWAVYGQSKLANLLFTMELQRRADAAGADLVSVAAHPGWSATNLVLAGPGAGRPHWLSAVLDAGNRLVAQSAEAGAWPTLFAATDPGVRGAEFFGPGSLGGTRGHPARTVARAPAYDPDLAAALWQRSSELTGVRFDFSHLPAPRAPLDDSAPGPALPGAPLDDSAPS